MSLDSPRALRTALEPPLPESWANRYGPLTEQLNIDTRSYQSAVTIVADLWRAMFPNEEI